MFSARGIERLTGLIFLLLIIFAVVSMVVEIEIDTDIGDFRESLQNVAEESGRYLTGVSFGFVANILLVGIGGALYLVFRRHERNLAILTMLGLLGVGLIFMVEDMTRFALEPLAQQFAAANDGEADAVAASARAIALTGEFAHEIAITFFGLSVLFSGILIAWSVAVYRLLGWVGGLGGLLLLFHWLWFLNGDLIVVAYIGLVAVGVYFFATGIWLIVRGTKEPRAIQATPVTGG